MKKTTILFLIIFSNLSYGQIPNQITSEEKIYGLSKFWQEVNYNFVYLNKVNKTDWDKLYIKLILEVQNTNNDYEYYRLLQMFCAFLKDGHTNVWFPKYIQDNVYTSDFGKYRFFLSNIDKKAIITSVNHSKKDELPIGTEIVKVNGLKTQEHLERNVFPYISSSTDFIRENWGIERMLEGYVGTTYELEMLLPNGNVKTLKVTNTKATEEEMYPKFENRELLEFKWLKNDIAYVALNSFDNWEISSSFNEKIPELKKAKKLIIDLRYNGGGNSNIGKVIFHRLTNDTIMYGPKKQSRLHIPTLKAWKQDKYYYDFQYKPDTLGIGDRNLLRGNRIVIPTAVLIGNNTASAAEDFLIYADKQKHITKIGQPTFGSTGQPLSFNMPNGGIARVCTKKDTYPDGREFVGYGITPDIEVIKKMSDYILNKDPVLEKAIELLNKK